MCLGEFFVELFDTEVRSLKHKKGFSMGKMEITSALSF